MPEVDLVDEGFANGDRHRLYPEHLKTATIIQAQCGVVAFRDGKLYQPDVFAMSGMLQYRLDQMKADALTAKPLWNVHAKQSGLVPDLFSSFEGKSCYTQQLILIECAKYRIAFQPGSPPVQR